MNWGQAKIADSGRSEGELLMCSGEVAPDLHARSIASRPGPNFDGFPALHADDTVLVSQLDYLRSGHVDTLYAQDCYGWGYRSVEILLEKIINGKAPTPAKVVDSLTEVTSSSVDSFGKNWEKWLAK